MDNTLTPSEAFEAMNRGATAVKLLPGSSGGPLFGDAGSGGDLAPVREHAGSFVALASAFDRRLAESRR